ncbi:MAG: type I secretion C-terminal target domain-containing protein, partial [Alphaproteobacteria bacterium]|nr:type I secretion C-terminal target domain-containing protein [Alphaproteobacteria bacterium]
FFMVMGEAANGFAAPQFVTWGDGVRSQGGVTTFTATTGSGQASKVVAELVIRADGSYDFTLNAPVLHTASGKREDNTELVFNYTVVDGDGDRASGRLVVSVNDDTPVANVEVSGTQGSEGALFTAGADGVQSVSITGTPFRVGYSGPEGGNSENARWNRDGVTSSDGTTTFTAFGAKSNQPVAILIIKADGSYSFELLVPARDASTSIAFTVVDGDGDKASGTLNLDLVNDVPSRVMPLSVGYSAVDPLVLDLEGDGFDLAGLDQAVMFDINADGHKDQIGWTSKDGILAHDLNGNGVIDDGSEIFTPDFNGGKFESGIAALASLDSNGDGKIDNGDDAFSSLKIWVDANNNGVSDEGELSSLFDNGVASISLSAEAVGEQEDGQTIFAKGEFTFADGSTGDFVEVGFDTIFGSGHDGQAVIGTDGDDVLHGGMGRVVMTGGAGADTFVFDETALNALDVADVITDFSSNEGDALDVTALLDSLLGEQADEASAASVLRVTVDAGDTTISVQTGQDAWKDVVVLQNHEAAVKILFDDKHTLIAPQD